MSANQAASMLGTHPTARSTSVQLKDIQKTLPRRVLSPEDWQHWITQGYVIIRQAVSAANVEQKEKPEMSAMVASAVFMGLCVYCLCRFFRRKSVNASNA